MFKALDKRDGSDVVILSPLWTERVEELRVLGHQNFLVCQGCHQPLRVRAGAVKVRHFAHKHLQDCSYGQESPLLLQLRAILYNRLFAEFGSAVTLEKQINGVALPRPIDCWVEGDQENIAYWIVEKALRPQVREELSRSFSVAKARIHWICSCTMLRHVENNDKALVLTTTERAIMTPTAFDNEILDGLVIKGRTLHYLDPNTEELITFRGLRLNHSPQVYTGQLIQHVLADVMVARKTGDFAHPGERERLAQFKQEKKNISELMVRSREAVKAQKESEIEARIAGRNWITFQPSILNRPTLLPATQEEHNPDTDIETRMTAFSQPKEGICVYCGDRTTSWWQYDGKTGTCKCRKCQQDGKKE